MMWAVCGYDSGMIILPQNTIISFLWYNILTFPFWQRWCKGCKFTLPFSEPQIQSGSVEKDLFSEGISLVSRLFFTVCHLKWAMGCNLRWHDRPHFQVHNDHFMLAKRWHNVKTDRLFQKTQSDKTSLTSSEQTPVKHSVDENVMQNNTSMSLWTTPGTVSFCRERGVTKHF